MRTILVGNKRIKLIAHQRFSNDESWDESVFEFKEIGTDHLSFSRPTDAHALKNLDYVEIFFMISGKWKKFKITEFSPVITDSSNQKITEISFKLSDADRPQFDQSFRIARCC